MKVCTKCGIEQALAEFYEKPAHRDGLDNVCRSCAREHSRADYYRRKAEGKKKPKWPVGREGHFDKQANLHYLANKRATESILKQLKGWTNDE